MYRNTNSFINNKYHSEKATKPLTKDQIKDIKKYYSALLHSSENEYIGKRNVMLVQMQLQTGFRISDIVKMKVSDVVNYDIYDDFYGRRIIDITEIKDNIKLLEQKTKTQRSVKISAWLKERIKLYLNANGVRDKIQCNDDYLFISEKYGDDTSRYISAKSASAIMHQVGKTINWDVSSHTMRKTYGSIRYNYADDKERALAQISELYGHANTEITRKYIYINNIEMDDIQTNSRYDLSGK